MRAFNSDKLANALAEKRDNYFSTDPNAAPRTSPREPISGFFSEIVRNAQLRIGQLNPPSRPPTPVTNNVSIGQTYNPFITLSIPGGVSASNPKRNATYLRSTPAPSEGTGLVAPLFTGLNI